MSSSYIACLLVPAPALGVEVARRPELRGRPVAIASACGQRVAEASPAAARRGVRPGQRVSEAVAWCPGLVVLAERPARVRRAASQLVDAVATVSPLVEEAAPGEVYADLRGLDGLYPEVDTLAQALLGPAPHALGARLGVAGSRFTARAAASVAPPGGWLRVAEGEARAFLDALPIGLLPLGGADRDWLAVLGLVTLGDLAALPRHAVEAQLGSAGTRAWLAARGEDASPLIPRPPRERVRERAQAEPPLISREAVLMTFEQLLGRALSRPPARGRLVRSVHLGATTGDERLWERTRVLTEPTGDRSRLWTAVRPSIETAAFGGPVAELALELDGLTVERGLQGRLLHDLGVRRRERLDEMARHLQLRYSRAALRRVVALVPDSRIPERRYALADYDP